MLLHLQGKPHIIEAKNQQVNSLNIGNQRNSYGVIAKTIKAWVPLVQFKSPNNTLKLIGIQTRH